MNPDDPKIQTTTKSFEDPIVAFEDPLVARTTSTTTKPPTIDKTKITPKQPIITPTKTSGS